MNGPEVIEQEAGIGELDAGDKRLIWSLIGGEQRAAVGLVDTLVEDDADAVGAAVRAAFRAGPPPDYRSRQVPRFLERLRAIDPLQVADGAALRALWGEGGSR
jgi:malonate decarboxylase beta subunit